MEVSTLSGYAERLQKSVSGVLRPQERIVAAIRTQPRGTVAWTAAGGLFGAAAASHQAKKARAGATEGSIAASWPTAKFALGLTDQRLLAFNYTAMGKPKDLQTEIPLSDVANIEKGDGKITNTVRLAFADGSALELECAKLEKVGDFIGAFQTMRGRS